MRKNLKKLFLFMAVVMTAMVCLAFSASAETYCIEASPEVNAKALEYLDEIYIEKFPGFGLEFPFGSEGDKKVLKSAADKITKGARTDKEKVELIVNWINRNIDYRSYTTDEGYIYAIDTYYNKKGNCLGISQLILNFCRLSGIKAVMCCGPRGDMENVLTLESKEPDHAWTMIYLDGEWYLYDPLFNVYGTKDKKFIDKWYFFDFIEGVSPYVEKYAKYIFSQTCIFYIDGRFVSYTGGVPSYEYYGNNYSPAGSCLNNCMPFYTIARWFNENGGDDGHEYVENPERKYNMIIDECYSDGWLTYGPSLYHVNPNSIQTGARIMDYDGQCLYFSFMSSAVIPSGKAEDFTCTDGYLTMYEGQKLDFSFTWEEDALSEGRHIVCKSFEPEIATINNDGVVTAVSEGLVTFSAYSTDEEVSGYWNGALFQVYVIPEKRTVEYAFCNENSADDEHSYKTVTTKATVKNNGNVKIECENCGKVKSTETIYSPKTITLSKTSYTYNGKEQKPTVTVKDSKGNTLKNGTDYTVKYESGRKAPGRYNVKITFKGKYSGTKTLKYTIAPKATSKVTAAQSTKAIKLTWSKVTGAEGYRVYMYNASTKKWESVKTTTATSCKVEKLKAGTTYKFKIKAYKKDDGTIWGKATEVITVATKPATPKITKLTATKSKASLVWSDVDGENGYEVYCSTKKDSGFKKVATAKANTTKATVSKLTSGKTYYLKVRAYKTVDGAKIYSSWSAVKSVKIK